MKPRGTSKRPWRFAASFPQILAILVVGMAIRVALIGSPSYFDDAKSFTKWANALAILPLREFYVTGVPACDYLPGYLYPLALTARLRAALAGSVGSPADFALWIKVVPILTDLVLAAVAAQICWRPFGRNRSLLAAAFVAFNPGIVLLSSVWGQVDSVGAALSMVALASVLAGNPILAALFAGASFLVKPHYAPFLAIAAAAYLRRETDRLPALQNAGGPAAWGGWAARRLVLPCLVMLFAVELFSLPFGMSLWPMQGARWNLVSRFLEAAGKYPVTSASAFNLWGLPMAGFERMDSAMGWLGITYHDWGTALAVPVFLLAIIVAWVRAADTRTVLWASYVAAFAQFEFLTRMHERYLFVAVPLAIVASGMRGFGLLIALGVSLFYLLNVGYIYVADQTDKAGGDLLNMPTFIDGVTIFGLLLFLASLARLILYLLPEMERSLGNNTARIGSNLNSAWHHPKAKVAALIISLSVIIAAALLLSGMQPNHTSGIEGTMVSVRADEEWQDSGTWVSAGQRVQVTVTGMWAFGEGEQRVGPAGAGRIDQKAVLSGAPIGSTIGRVGTGQPFAIGSGDTFVAEDSGYLQLAINDAPGGFGDNRGRVLATISFPNP